MEDIELKIGDCSCRKQYRNNGWQFPLEDTASYCPECNEIVLGEACTDGLIERFINHETIHYILNAILGKFECWSFDHLFKNKQDLYGTYGQYGEPVEITGSLTDDSAELSEKSEESPVIYSQMSKKVYKGRFPDIP